MRRQLALFTLAALAASFSAGAATIYYVQSNTAKIKAEPSFKSKIVTEVTKGKQLTALAQQGIWVKVNADGKEGYLPSLLLSTHPPLAVTTVIRDDAEISQGVRRRASSFSSAAAARGLTREDRQRDGIEEGIDYAALKKMESLSLSPDEVTQFIAGRKP